MPVMNFEFEILNLKFRAEGAWWLPDMDSNHDKLLQRQLCYRYTIGQDGGFRLYPIGRVSRLVKSLKRCLVTTWDARRADLFTMPRFNDLTLQRN
jgi:hypothetical protein